MKRPDIKRFVPTLTFGRVIGGAAVIVLVTAGSAYAANEWTGANIVDGSLTGADLANNTVARGWTSRTTRSAVPTSPTTPITNVDIADNTIRSNELQNNAVTAVKILDATITGQRDVARRTPSPAPTSPMGPSTVSMSPTDPSAVPTWGTRR